MSILGLDNEHTINKAMIDGLASAFKREIKDVLMEVVEKEVDGIVKQLSEQLEVHLKTHSDVVTGDHKINLVWILKKEE